MFTGAAVALLSWTGIARATAGLQKIPVLLQPRCEKDNPIICFGEGLLNIGELIGWIGQSGPGIPDVMDIIGFFLGDQVAKAIDEGVPRLLQVPRPDEPQFWWIAVAFFSAVGFALLVAKGIWWLLKLSYYTPRHGPEAVVRGHTDLSSPVVYLPERFFPSVMLVTFAPILLAAAFLFIRIMVVDSALALYESSGTTLGTATFEVLTDMLSGKGLIWFAIFFPFYVLLGVAFLLEYALEFIVAFLATIGVEVQVARYGDGVSPKYVITEPLGWLGKALLLMVGHLALLVLLPVMLKSRPFVWVQPLALLLWFVLAAGWPILMYQVVLPRMPEPKRVFHFVRHAVAPTYVAKEYVDAEVEYPERTEGGLTVDEDEITFGDRLGQLERAITMAGNLAGGI